MQQPSTPIGTEVRYEGGDHTVMGYVYYGEAGWYYVLLDEYAQEHDVHCSDIDDFNDEDDYSGDYL